ncbi:MAG: 50S ribosomal protein L17 [Candidatus Pacebacteria bacterium]|nr:50S ribosomal protein L17 [Candidatus Paceibacterota bacterium]MBP9839431.1 50S ribosomal protein L17 [Candidatus Paceibacterota bacterium]MDQ5922555.1 large subunit ribosomal protein [Patescibacteria group bacterium]
MRHHNSKRKFGRTKNLRNALLKSLALSLIMRGKIKTTEAKAKELKPYVEKMITVAKKNTQAGKRITASKMYNNKKLVKKLFDEVAPKYADRKGGYIRIIKLGVRKSDSAKMAQIEFV